MKSDHCFNVHLQKNVTYVQHLNMTVFRVVFTKHKRDQLISSDNSKPNQLYPTFNECFSDQPI